uniref:alcohol dehydrogenase n=1 Tax=Caenorhabditis tropicalis TaxID=1561998 RepID=A0A1I7UBW4_9PELO
MSDIPSTQRVLIFDEYNGPLVVRKAPVPEPLDDELLVKVEYSGICHSDLHSWNGDFDYATICPLIGGHEGAGSVVKIGSKVRDWKLGDRAGVKLVNANCLNCEYCKTGHEPLCDRIQNYGFDCHGTFQEYMTIRDVDAIKISKDMNLASAAPVLCGGVTAYKALKEANLKSGQIVAITGAGGGLGSFGIQYAKAMGLRVIAIDHSSKKEHCEDLGAEWFVDGFETSEIVDHIKKITNGGPHGVVSFVSAKKPMEQALEYVRKRGTVVLVGLPKDSQILVNTTLLIFNSITIKGSLIGSRLDTDEALDFVSRGVVKVPLEFVRLEDVPIVYEKMKEGKVNSRVVVDFSL